MLSVLLALAILSLPLILAYIASSDAASSGARDTGRRELAPVRVRAETPRIQRRRVR